MESRSEINYWLKTNEELVNILTVPTVSVPTVDEIIHIDTTMSKEWYDMKFPNHNGKFFDAGVYSDFKVISIKRWYSTRNIVNKELNMPTQSILENFEVYVIKV